MSKHCYEKSADSDDICFYDTYSSSSVVHYVCDYPYQACNITLCETCVPVMGRGLSIASIVISCIFTLVAIAAVVIASRK